MSDKIFQDNDEEQGKRDRTLVPIALLRLNLSEVVDRLANDPESTLLVAIFNHFIAQLPAANISVSYGMLRTKLYDCVDMVVRADQAPIYQEKAYAVLDNVSMRALEKAAHQRVMS